VRLQLVDIFLRVDHVAGKTGNGLDEDDVDHASEIDTKNSVNVNENLSQVLSNI
jgi:hypothetical protein